MIRASGVRCGRMNKFLLAREHKRHSHGWNLFAPVIQSLPSSNLHGSSFIPSAHSSFGSGEKCRADQERPGDERK